MCVFVLYSFIQVPLCVLDPSFPPVSLLSSRISFSCLWFAFVYWPPEPPRPVSVPWVWTKPSEPEFTVTVHLGTMPPLYWTGVSGRALSNFPSTTDWQPDFCATVHCSWETPYFTASPCLPLTLPLWLWHSSLPLPNVLWPLGGPVNHSVVSAFYVGLVFAFTFIHCKERHFCVRLGWPLSVGIV